MQATANIQSKWNDICDVSDLVNNSGVCALLEGQQIAIFSIVTEQSTTLYALSNWDPVGKANVMYRGIVGSIKDEPVVASPLYKEHYSLVTGKCFEKDDMSLLPFDIKVEGSRVLVALS